MFYDKYVKLCNSVNMTPSAVALEIGLEKSTVTRWKQGGNPTDATLQKVADYFNVPCDSLEGPKSYLQIISEDHNLNAGAELLQQRRFDESANGSNIGFDDFSYAMFNEGQNLTEGDKSLLLQMARQLSEKNKKSGKAD